MEIVKYQIGIKEESLTDDGYAWFGTPFDTLKEAMEVALNTDFEKENALYLGTWFVTKRTFNDETCETTPEVVYHYSTEEMERYKILKRNVAEYKKEIAELKSNLKADEEAIKRIEERMKENDKVLEEIKKD